MDKLNFLFCYGSSTILMSLEAESYMLTSTQCHEYFSPNPNILIELFHALHKNSARHFRQMSCRITYASQTCSTGIPFTLAMTYATCGMVAGSFLPFTIAPRSHFSFFTALGSGGAPALCFADAWEGLISHSGYSQLGCSQEF